MSPDHEMSTADSHLSSARSVADMSQENQDCDNDTKAQGEPQQQTWEEIASSEPSLLDTQTIRRKAATIQHQLSDEQEREASKSNISGAHSTTNLTQDGQRLQTWMDSHDGVTDEGTAKKKSIKSSLKNMFTFKKR